MTTRPVAGSCVQYWKLKVMRSSLPRMATKFSDSWSAIRWTLSFPTCWCPIWTVSDFAGRSARMAAGTRSLLSATPRFTARWTMKSWPLIWGQMPTCASPLQRPPSWAPCGGRLRRPEPGRLAAKRYTWNWTFWTSTAVL